MASNGTIDPDSIHLPRILCIHGGGVNAKAFTQQARPLAAALAGRFRLVFADGPFLCDAHPGILPVYAGQGPFRRWLRWLPEQKEHDAETVRREIWRQVRATMQHDDEMAGEAAGEWVAVLGFSQGAKVAASLLFDQQAREAAASGSAESNWRFAVILAGRAPLVSLSPATADIPNLATAAQVSNGWEEIEADDDARHVLRLPTVHVHGLQDPGLHLHRRLFRQYCAPGSATLVEWDGIHRVPFKSADIQKVTEAILDVARRTGVIEKDA